MSDNRPILAIIGGTGDLGSALAGRWAKAGYPVIIGSRDRARAEAAAAALTSHGSVSGADNLAAAIAGEIVVIAVPWPSHDTTLAEIRTACAGKIVIDAAVPLVPPKVAVVQLPEGGSAAQRAKTILGDDVRVVSAFHNVAAGKLAADKPVDCDVLVFGDDKPARDAVITLTQALGLRGIDGGALANSAAAEALTSVLIGINRRYKSDGAGIRITGLPE